MAISRPPFYYTVATIANFSPVMTMPPVCSSRCELVFVAFGFSEGFFFLYDFSFFFIIFFGK